MVVKVGTAGQFTGSTITMTYIPQEAVCEFKFVIHVCKREHDGLMKLIIVRLRCGPASTPT